MGNYRNFTLTTYFVAHAAARVTREELEGQIAFLERYMKLDKVYLEPWRGEMASHEQIEMIREVFHRHGVQVAGGLTTVIPTPEGDEPKKRLFDTFCYNDPKMTAKLKEVCTFIGEHFDEFIIDDFFFTNCTCADCARERDAYNRAHGIAAGWRDYRLDLLRRVSEECIIGPAKKANPNCKITIKYPNWAESYQETGYNPGEQRKIFDKIYTGTETRDPVTTDQHLPRYLSYSLMTYFENMWPGHNGGGWFDTFDMQITEHYLEQVYLTAFSRPRELMMFCFQSLLGNRFTASLGFELERLDEALDQLGRPAGFYCYLPDNCQGEDNVQDYLGMNGLPVVCTPYFPDGARQILLTASSACDPRILEKMDAWLQRTGGTALVTSGFWSAVRDRGYENFTSIRPSARRVTARSYRVEEVENICTFPAGAREISLPVMEFRNNSTWALVKAVHGEESYGILLRDDCGKGKILTLAVPDAYPDFYQLPAAVWNRIRQELPVEGIRLEGPGRISIFPTEEDSFILYPYVMRDTQRTRVTVHVQDACGLEMICTNAPGYRGGKREILPLYTKQGEAAFEIPVLPGIYSQYRILRKA